uniref:(northern house mosquito) hypothetical protein n=1 Tax=Culex pipiens TaxID=7175 RepID=A0A8D7ZUV1_CULPI
MEVVCQLHLQLQKERDRLQAMILHLNKKNEMAARIPMAGAGPFVPQIPPPPPPYDLIAGLRFPPAAVGGPDGPGGMVEAVALQLTNKQQQSQQQQALHHHHQQQQSQQAGGAGGKPSKGGGGAAAMRAKYFGSQEAQDGGVGGAGGPGFKEINYPDVQDGEWGMGRWVFLRVWWRNKSRSNM